MLEHTHPPPAVIADQAVAKSEPSITILAYGIVVKRISLGIGADSVTTGS